MARTPLLEPGLPPRNPPHRKTQPRGAAPIEHAGALRRKRISAAAPEYACDSFPAAFAILSSSIGSSPSSRHIAEGCGDSQTGRGLDAPLLQEFANMLKRLPRRQFAG